MSKPLKNDFGVFVSRSKARAALLANGFTRYEPLGNLARTKDGQLFIGLRHAWAFHTGVQQ